MRNTIDLVVMSSVRKCQQFMQEGVEPVGLPWQMDVSCFDLGRLRHHAIRFASLRLPTDRAWHSPRQIAPEILQERHAGARILDQDGSGTVLRRETRDLAPKVGVLEPGAEHVDEVVVRFDDPPSRADGIVVGIARHHGDVPALHDALGGSLGQVVIVSEPVSPNEIAFERNRPLLILGGELQAADLRLDAVESVFALALRMQDVADSAVSSSCRGRGE